MEDKKRKKDDKRKREASQKVSMFRITCNLLHLSWTPLNKRVERQLDIFVVLLLLLRECLMFVMS